MDLKNITCVKTCEFICLPGFAYLKIIGKEMYEYDYYDNYYDYPSSTWYDYSKWRRSMLRKRKSYILDGDKYMDILEGDSKPKEKPRK